MRINIDEARVFFKDLAPGGVFRYAERFYLRLDTPSTAANLETGVVQLIPPQALIQPCSDIELTGKC